MGLWGRGRCKRNADAMSLHYLHFSISIALIEIKKQDCLNGHAEAATALSRRRRGSRGVSFEEEPMRLRQLACSAVLTMLMVGTTAAEDNQVGAKIFDAHCAACHGTTGLGDGEFADVLKVKPADLTTLTARNHGEFPYLTTLRTIDGRTTVRGHGVMMPVWGDVFRSEIGDAAGPYGAELLIRAQMVALVDYIETLQK